MTINSETFNQFEVLQKVIDGYRQRVEQIENDPSLAALGNMNNSVEDHSWICEFLTESIDFQFSFF